MDAAHTHRPDAARVAARLLDSHLADRPVGGEDGSARARLETELGGELARLLFSALVGRRQRDGSLTAV